MRTLAVLVCGLVVGPALGQEWRYPVHTENGLALIDDEGRVRGENRFDEANPFSGPIGAVKQGGLWGYVDGDGEWIIRPSFLEADDFAAGRARVKSPEGWTIIDVEGRSLTTRHYPAIHRISAGITAYEVDEGGRVAGRTRKSGLLSSEGVELTEPRFDGAGTFVDGLIPVQVYRKFLMFRLERRWGYADSTGKVVIKPSYSSARPFSEGLALVSDGRGAGYIDARGELVLALQYEAAGSFHDGRARVGQQGRWGFIDRGGVEVVPLEYVAVGEFSEGLAAVRWADLWGYIDTAGREIIPASFEIAGRFQGPLARVVRDGREEYIDRAGNVVWSGN